MGVPKFYRWVRAVPMCANVICQLLTLEPVQRLQLSERYPKINQIISDLMLMPEFDNLYLDMNGIIHQ